MKKILFFLMFSALAAAQVSPPSTQSRVAGRFVAYNYGLWSLPVYTMPSGTGSQTFTLSNSTARLQDGRVIMPFAVNAPLRVGSETVTVTAVGAGCIINSTVIGGCSITATFTLPHTVADPVASGTWGLQEALNDAAASGGGTVTVDSAWTARGGTSGMVSAATIPSSTGIEDERTGPGSSGGGYPGVTSNGAGGLNVTGAVAAGSETLGSPLLPASGGTGANTAAGALANLGGLPLSGGTLTGALNGTSASFSGAVASPAIVPTNITPSTSPVCANGTGGALTTTGCTGGTGGSYLPLSGGTLTGALSGTSASFSGNVSAGAVAAPLTSQSGVIAISGNSWCAGEGVYSPAQSYPALLASMHGTGIRKDACYESNQAADDAVAVLANYQKTVTPAVFPEPLYIEVEGNNDAVYCNGGTSTTAGCEANFVMAYTAEQAYEGLPRTAMTYAQDAGCTKTTGTWSNDNIYQVGMGEIASSTGATLTCNFTSTGGAVAEVFGAIDGSAGTATIRIDGGTSTTLNAFGNSGQTIATLRQLTYSPFGVLLTGISAGSHTAVITVTSAPVQASLTTYSAVGNWLITFPVTNSFSAGTVGTFSGFSGNLTSLNGCTGTVSATGLSGSNFEVLYYGNPVNCPPLVTSSGSETGTFSTNFFTQLFVGSPAAASNTSLMAGVWKEYADTTSAQTSAYDALVSGLSSTLNAGGFNTTFIPMRGGALNYGSDFLAVPYCSGAGNGSGGHANCIGAAHVAKQFQVTRPDLFQPYAGSNPYFAGPIQVQTTNTNGYYGYGSFNNFAGGNSQGTGVFQTTALNSGILISNFGNGYVSGITEVPWNGSQSAMALFENGSHAIVLCTELTGPTKWWTAQSSDITGTLSGQTLSQCPFVFTPGNGAFHATHVYADTDLYLAGALFTPVSANSPLTITSTTTPQITAAYDSSHKFELQADSNGNGYLVAPTSGSSIYLYPANTKIMQITTGGLYESATGTAVSGTNYASPWFVTTASAYISGAAVAVQLSDYLNFNTMSSTPTYSVHQLVNGSTTLPMVTEMVGTPGHYLDLNQQASTSYVLNHASDMFYATDKYAPAWYANSVLSFGLGYTGTTAATSCGSLSGAAGCLTVPIAGVTHYVPFF